MVGSHEREILRLLKCKFYPAREGFPSWGLTAGSRDPSCDITASGEFNGVNDIWRHHIIGVAISKFWLEAREELLFTAIPCDVNFDARDLSAVGVQYQHL